MTVEVVQHKKRNVSKQDFIIYFSLFIGVSYFFLLSVYAGFYFDERNVFAIIINNSDGILTPFKVWMHRPIGYKIYIYLLSLIPGVHHYYYLNNLIFVYLLLTGHNVIRLIGAYLITKAFVSDDTPYKQHITFFAIYACTASLVSWELPLNAEDAAINVLMLSTGLLLRKSNISILFGALLMATLPYFKGITAIYAIPIFALVFLFKKELFMKLILICGTMFTVLTLFLIFFTPEFKELFEMPTYEVSEPLSAFLKMMFYHQHYWVIENPSTALMLALGFSMLITVYEKSTKKYMILSVIVICMTLPIVEIVIQHKAWGHNGTSGTVIAIAFIIMASRLYKSFMFIIAGCIYIAVQTTCGSLFVHNFNGQFARDLQNMVNNADKVIEKNEPVLNLTFSLPYIGPLQVKRPSASRYAINVPFDRVSLNGIDKNKLKATSGYQYVCEYVKNFNGNFMMMTAINTGDMETFKLVEDKIKSGYSRYFYVDNNCTEWPSLKIFIKNEYNKPIPEDVKIYTFSQ